MKNFVRKRKQGPQSTSAEIEKAIEEYAVRGGTITVYEQTDFESYTPIAVKLNTGGMYYGGVNLNFQ